MRHTVKIAFVVGVSLFLGGVCNARAGIIEDLGPEMWFDATVASSITVNGSNQVTSWADLASGGRVATAGASDNVLLGNNGWYGSPSIDFTTAGTLNFSTNQVSTGKTVFTLFQTNDTNIAWTNPIGGNFHLTDGDNRGYRGFVRSGGAIRIQPKLSPLNEWAIQTMEYDIGDRFSLWVDGNQEGTLSNTNSTSEFQGLGHNGFNGSIAQVIVFDGALTPSQRQGVEQQMMSRLATTIHVGGENTIGTDTRTGEQGNEETAPGVAGARFVRVLQNVNDTFQVAELQIFETGTGTNVALAGTATAKDNYQNNALLPARTNDNNTSGQWSDNSVWHSASAAGTWVQIELAADTDLDAVHFWGRTDCCQARQDDFNLIITDASNNELYNQRHTGIGTSPGRNQLIPLESVVSADLTAKLVDLHTYLFELDADSNDQLTVDNPNPGMFTTVIDVNNATIEVAALGDLTPGSVYQLLDADLIIGTYDNLILPDGVDGSMLLVDGTVSAVPEPSSIMLAALGLGGLALVFCGRRRKR